MTASERPAAAPAEGAQDMNTVIADNLRALRQGLNLSLSEVSERTGVSKSMLGQIERLRSFLYEHVYARTNAIIEESRVEHVITALFNKRMECNGGSAREAVDMISGMTDRFALHMFQKSFVPRPWPKVTGFYEVSQ